MDAFALNAPAENLWTGGRVPLRTSCGFFSCRELLPQPAAGSPQLPHNPGTEAKFLSARAFPPFPQGSYPSYYSGYDIDPCVF